MRAPSRLAVLWCLLAVSSTASATDFGEVEFVSGQVTLQTQESLVHGVKEGETVGVGARTTR